MKVSFYRLRKLFERSREYPPAAGNKWIRPDVEAFLNRFMVQNRPYLLNRYSLYQLSADTGIAISDLLAVIGGEKGLDFKAFINHHRIHYCQQLLKRMPLGKISLFDLSIICGFTNQREFNNCFKKVVGVSVCDYLDEMYQGRPPGHFDEKNELADL